MAASPGRPKSSNNTAADDKRAQLLAAALALFTARPYAMVSTRQIAAKAGVNASLIRYYFLDKAGLFEAMIVETLSPFLRSLEQAKLSGKPDPAALIHLYYQVMQPNPDLPKLLVRSLWDPASVEYQLLAPVFSQFAQYALPLMQQVLGQPDVLQEDVDINAGRLAVMSLAIFPFLAPKMVLEQLQLQLNPESLQRLAQQHGRLLHQGIFARKE
ncbi:MAG TPA: TetR/AcrR family transcriptional regulator [Rheinheimera sp.]|nr:TetR/AcrR family transcriptional regulator [Rheinheimera sp.]